MIGSPLITRVRIEGYKSVTACDVDLGALTILVGPNGSGKSNFLDALRFTSEALSSTLNFAVRERGGMDEVLDRSQTSVRDLVIRLDLQLPDGGRGHYAFRIEPGPATDHQVTDEECEIVDAAGDRWFFRTFRGSVSSNVREALPAAARDRLYLVNASNLSAFRPVYDALTSTGFYNLNPAMMRDPQPLDPKPVLRRDGDNLASVVRTMWGERGDAFTRVTEYMRRVVPGLEAIVPAQLGSFVAIEFYMRNRPDQKGLKFQATNMSDGTLRALGVLVALLQATGRFPLVVGVEEPETALHPAAVAVLLDAARDASRHAQVILTSHSPDLLDRDDISDDALLAVSAEHGRTVIGRVDEAGRAALRDHLFTAGELLRMNQLEPEVDSIHPGDRARAKLFDL
jgi:predicted ATPase